MSTYVITGANRGIGLELCKQLSARDHDVIGLCRQSSAPLETLGVRVETGIDVSRDDVIPLLRERLAGTSIDVLVNNAGILSSESLDDLDFERMRRQFEINSLGPLRVSSALLDNLSPGSKIGIITSRMGSISDNSSGSRYGYRMSKAAVNATGVSLARDLHDRGIAVALLHPGFVRTDMTRHNGLVDPSESVAGLLARLDELSLDNSGSFWHMNGESLPW
jgi:NAD(P)-dependent dehydrogenase (short-subunit alcohol dehydrogenase family)